jgi:hypothetical protein
MAQNNPKRSADSGLGPRVGDPQRSERRDRRTPLSVALRISGFSAGGRIFSEVAATRNISPSGCCVRLCTCPLEHCALAVQVVPREGAAPEGGVQLLYQVVWLQYREGAWDVGLSALSEADLLRVAFASRTP